MVTSTHTSRLPAVALAAAVVSWLAISSAPAAATVATPPAALETAVRAFNSFELARAGELLDTHEANHGAGPWTRYYRARIAALRGDVAAARRIADACVKAHPERSICHEARGEAAIVQLVLEGNVFKMLGAAGRARRSLESAVERDPENLRARLMLVRFYSQAPWIAGGSSRKARRHAEACERRDAAWGHEARALLALADNRYGEAIEGFSAARRLRPDDRDPAYYLARAYVGNNQPEAAIEVLEALVDRYPKFHQAWLELGTIAADRGVGSVRGTAALEHYLDNAEDVSPKQQARAAESLGRLYLQAGRKQDAARAFQRALESDTSLRSARKALADLCAEDETRCG